MKSNVKSNKEKKQNRKKEEPDVTKKDYKDVIKKNSFDVAFIILFYLFINIAITSIMFFFKVSINSYNFILSVLFTFIFTIYLFYRRKYLVKEIICLVLLLVGIFLLSFFFAGRFYDVSEDGNSYHKTAIGMLKDGWNPVYQEIEEFNEEKEEIQLNNTHSLWNNHYAKGYWMYGANIYKVFNNIETGKSFIYLIGWATFFIALSFFIKKINLIYALILSLLLAYNPIFLVQVNTYYNDASVGNLVIILVISFILLIDSIEDRKKLFVLLFINLAILINIKFTGFLFAGIFSLGYYIYILSDKKLRKEIGLKITITAIMAVLFSVFIIGYSTYVTNFIKHKNPFFPLIGKGKADIMTHNQPKSFVDQSRINRFILANFSKCDNIFESSNKVITPKIPFTIIKDEVKLFKIPDARIGGYGVLFGGILILSFVLEIFNFKKINKGNWKIYILLSIPIITNIFLIFALDNLWWARYFPMLYLFPVFVIVKLLLLQKEKIIADLLIILLIINSFLIFKTNIKYQIKTSKNIKTSFEVLRKDYMDKDIFLYTEGFDGTVYNAIDALGKDNIKILNERPENEEREIRVMLSMLNIHTLNKKEGDIE